MSYEDMDNDIAAAVIAGRQTAHPHELTRGGYWVVATPGGVSTFDLTGDEYRDYPRRIRQKVEVSTTAAFCDYWTKHADADSECYADPDKRTVTAVLDAHHHANILTDDDARARWQQHTCKLTLTLSHPLKAWAARDGHLYGQEDFAEFLSEQRRYILDPPGADLVEMIQAFRATISAEFKSGFKVTNGQRQLAYTETVNASVHANELPVPETLRLGLPVWRNDPANTGHEFFAELRFRVNHGGPGKLGIGFKLIELPETLDEAFTAEVEKIGEHVGRSVMVGTP